MAVSTVKLNGTTLMTVNDTTATASDVAQTKYFYGADGVKTLGTASGGGGASNIVTGTFTGTTTGAAMDVTIPYTGTGFPIAVNIYVSEGADDDNSTFTTILQRYAIEWWVALKSTLETPLYDGGWTRNFGTGACRYKNSATDSTSEASTSFFGVQTLGGTNSSASRDGAVRFKNSTTMSVYIASSSYGFLANTQYTYHVIYSS